MKKQNTHTAIQNAIDNLYAYAAKEKLDLKKDDLVSVKNFHNGTIVLTLTGQKKQRCLKALVLNNHNNFYHQADELEIDLDIYASKNKNAINTHIDFDKPRKRSLLDRFKHSISKS